MTDMKRVRMLKKYCSVGKKRESEWSLLLMSIKRPLQHPPCSGAGSRRGEERRGERTGPASTPALNRAVPARHEAPRQEQPHLQAASLGRCERWR